MHNKRKEIQWKEPINQASASECLNMVLWSVWALQAVEKSSIAGDVQGVNNSLVSSLRFPKKMRLLKTYEFKRMARSSQKYCTKSLKITLYQNRHLYPRLGLLVLKKFGTACQRNRFKRIAREAFRSVSAKFCAGVDILIQPLPSARGLKADDLVQELTIVLEIESNASIVV